jgi:hypothetical protein
MMCSVFFGAEFAKQKVMKFFLFLLSPSYLSLLVSAAKKDIPV